MAADHLLSYPGFEVGFLVPKEHDPDQLDEAIAQIRRDVEASASKHLPVGCFAELQDTA